ncbi:hypothetical protein ACUOFC_44710, partial [Escherichia sp. TWPC-MK]
IERLSIINYLLNNNSKHYIELENLSKELLSSGTTKDLIAPKNIDFESYPERVEKRFRAEVYSARD